MAHPPNQIVLATNEQILLCFEYLFDNDSVSYFEIKRGTCNEAEYFLFATSYIAIMPRIAPIRSRLVVQPGTIDPHQQALEKFNHTLPHTGEAYFEAVGHLYAEAFASMAAINEETEEAGSFGASPTLQADFAQVCSDILAARQFQHLAVAKTMYQRSGHQAALVALLCHGYQIGWSGRVSQLHDREFKVLAEMLKYMVVNYKITSWVNAYVAQTQDGQGRRFASDQFSS